MDRCILDTSVIVKSIFKPLKSLSSEVYKREIKTHEECRFIIKKIEERGVSVFIPRVCIIETAAVVKRLSDKNFAREISNGLIDSYEIVDESFIFNSAWTIAINTGCSGFDSYFIALAMDKNATLLTDDIKMHAYAEEIGLDSFLIRETDYKEIENLLKE